MHRSGFAEAKADENTKQTPEDSGEEAEVATASLPNPSTDANGAPPPSDDEGYVWPEGAAAQTEENLAGDKDAEVTPLAPLPALDELVKRIPPGVRETLDDLFRVRFVSVKRAEARTLKN